MGASQSSVRITARVAWCIALPSGFVACGGATSSNTDVDVQSGSAITPDAASAACDHYFGSIFPVRRSRPAGDGDGAHPRPLSAGLHQSEGAAGQWHYRGESRSMRIGARRVPVSVAGRGRRSPATSAGRCRAAPHAPTACSAPAVNARGRCPSPRTGRSMPRPAAPAHRSSPWAKSAVKPISPRPASRGASA